MEKETMNIDCDKAFDEPISLRICSLTTERIVSNNDE